MRSVQQGAIKAQHALSIEPYLQPAAWLAVDAQADDVAAGGEARRVQEQTGQLRIDAALEQCAGVEAGPW